MSKSVIIAQVMRQKAEVDEMIAELREEGAKPEVIELLRKIKADANTLVEAMLDNSLIPREHEALDLEPEVKKIDKKIEKTKGRLGKIKKLEKEKEKIEEEIEEELREELGEE